MKFRLPMLLIILCSLYNSCSHRPAIPGNAQPVHVNNSRGHSSGRPMAPNDVPANKQTGQISATSARPQVGGGPVQDSKLSPQDIFAKYSPAVFMVFTSSGSNQFQGSGFFINSSGLAVSNYHVFEGTTIGYEVIKLQDGRQYKLKDIILKDKANDIMIFTIDSGSTSFKYLPLSTRKPRVGDKAYAIGSPRGLENTFSSGEISQLREDNIIQISVPIDHGSSGGALINEYGEAIGITSAGLDDSGANLNFAVSTDLVRKYLR